MPNPTPTPCPCGPCSGYCSCRIEGHHTQAAPTPNSPDRNELRADFRRYLELGLKPLWDKLELQDDDSTERLYDAIVEANMLAVGDFMAAIQQTIEAEATYNTALVNCNGYELECQPGHCKGHEKRTGGTVSTATITKAFNTARGKE